LQLAVESDRERLQQQGRNDPWFLLLEAAVACIISNQPEYVAQLFMQAVHFAPESAEASIRSSLRIYEDLGITGKLKDVDFEIGCIDRNVKRALEVLSSSESGQTEARGRQRILMFVGLRVDTSSEPKRFPPSTVDAARARIEEAIDDELKKDGGTIAFGIAAGANGGDLLFHEICVRKKIPTRLCLALRKPQYVGQYVAPAGKEWIERFSTIYNHIADHQKPCNGTADAGKGTQHIACSIRVFSEFTELPRWLQSKPLYNVGRRNNQWMLQYAIASAQELGPDTEITLLALWDEQSHRAVGVGGISDLIRKAALQGIKVVLIKAPDAAESSANAGQSKVDSARLRNVNAPG
jgi:hypothetical protein